jgi:hypothetical protein
VWWSTNPPGDDTYRADIDEEIEAFMGDSF